MNKDEEAMWNRLKEPAPVIDEDGDQRWFNKDGQLHRDNDSPAVIFEDGSKSWYKNGNLHRDNAQPARIWVGELKEWWVNGKFIK